MNASIDPAVLDEIRSKRHLSVKDDLPKLLSPKAMDFAMACIPLLTVPDATLADILPNEQTERAMISIDRGAGKWAVFKEDFTLIRPFEPYTDEKEALAMAKEWCKGWGDNSPRVVYPSVTSVRMK